MINIKMQPAQVHKLSPKIIVAGVGGAGGNAVNNMILENLEGCEFVVFNTDAQALENSLCQNKVQLGINVTGGLGAGSKPQVGKMAAEESLEDVMQYFEGANMAFITAGMGGGTGTGAAPVIARACRERGILTVGVVTKPFHFEGSHRMRSAESGIEEIQDYVDTLIVIPNQNLFRVANEKTTFAEGFQMADSVLQAGVRGVTDLMVRPGLVNLDFADIRTAMQEMGKAMMGTGEASGEKRAIEAAEAAINNPLLDDISMKGAHGVIINVTGGYDMTLFEADEACNRIRDEVDPDANIIFGATFDAALEGRMRVSIVATGIDKESEAQRRGGSRGTYTDAVSAPSVQIPSTSTKSVFTSARDVQAMRAPASFHPASPSAVGATQTLAPTPAQRLTEGYSSAQGAAAIKVQEPEADMFEQQEFEVPTSAEVVPTVHNTALRGTLHKNAFIPPRPVEVSKEDNTDEGQDSAAASGVGMSPVSRLRAGHPADLSQTMTAPALKLNPPVQQQAQTQKRTLSLFERITGSVQEHLGGGASHRERAEPSMASSPNAGRSAPLTGGVSGGAALQGKLNIDSPAKPAPSSEDLDIPAFLRRQAN